MKDGKILVNVKSESQARNLAKIEKLAEGISTKVYEHKTLNSCKVVVFCHDLKYDSDEDLLEVLSKIGIIEVRQITKGRDENKTPTGIFVLTVKGTVPPKEVKIGYLLLETRPWYPNPLRCFVCYKFGHIGKNCNSGKKCNKCGEGFHEICENAEKCINCGDSHGAFFKGCPAFKKEVAITKVKVDRNVNFWEARKIVESENKTSYSDSIKSALTQQLDEKIKELNEEKKTYAEALKLDLQKQFELKMKEMENKHMEMQKQFEQVVHAYKEEKQKRKTAEKELEVLKENYNKLQNTLKIYGFKPQGKHTRSQGPVESPPRKKKGNDKMQKCETVEYINSESDASSQEGGDDGMQP